LSTAEAEDLFQQLADLGCRRLTLSGGEPTTRLDWLDLIRLASAAGLQVGMFTNGLRFDQEAARRAERSGLSSVGFSIDGVGPTHDRLRGRAGHFRALIDAVVCARRAGLSITIVSTLHRSNLTELSALQALAREAGAWSWQVQPVMAMGNASEHPELLLRGEDLIRAERDLAALIERSPQRISVCNSFGYFGPHERQLRKSHGALHFKGCAAGTRTLGIQSNGDVKGCLSIGAGCGQQGDAYVEGNIRQEPLASIWNRPGAFAYNRQWRQDDLTGFCRRCRHAPLCRGGCRSMMVATSAGSENRCCVYRALQEARAAQASAGSQAWRQAGSATLMSLALLLAGPLPGCETPGSGDSAVEADTDTDTDADTDTDTDADSDADSDADADTDADAYDIDAGIKGSVDSDIDAERLLSLIPVEG